MQDTIIHLIGKPGVGKYTIGSHVARLTGACLVDNHSVANVIFRLIRPDGVTPLPEGIWGPVGQVRAAVLDTVARLSPPGMSFVFTNFMRGEDPGEYAAFLEMVALAEARASTFVPVILSCETPELVRRVVFPDRRERLKLVDPTMAARMNDEVPQFTTDHPHALSLDVTRLDPLDAARTIIAWTERCQGSPGA